MLSTGSQREHLSVRATTQPETDAATLMKVVYYANWNWVDAKVVDELII